MDNSETRNSSMIGVGGGIESSSSGIGGGGGGGSTSGVDYLNASELLNDDEAGIEDEEDGEDPAITSVYSTNYRLVGIVVHSGQANGGHYYSFIQNRTQSEQSNTSSVTGVSQSATSSGGISESNGSPAVDLSSSSSSSSSSNEHNWFKFDDNEVSEFRMDDDEMRAQCYGGDYTGEVYDNVMKRMAFKKQKRWWNAYILFYERIKHAENNKKEETAKTTSGNNSNSKEESESKNTTTVATTSVVNMPGYIVKSVHKKNIKFLHHRHHFSPEYFQFVKKLVQANLSLCQNDIPLVIKRRFVLFCFLVYLIHFYF